MSFFGGLKKGFNLGEDKFGPVGGLLGALGGGVAGLFGDSMTKDGSKGLLGRAADGGGQPTGPLSFGDKAGNLAARLGAAQDFMDGDWSDGAKALGGIKRPVAQGAPTLPQRSALLSNPITGIGGMRTPPIDQLDTQLWRRRNRGY